MTDATQAYDRYSEALQELGELRQEARRNGQEELYEELTQAFAGAEDLLTQLDSACHTLDEAIEKGHQEVATDD